MIPKNILWKMFKTSARKKDITRRNWSIAQKRGLLAIPKLDSNTARILKMYRDVQTITKAKNIQLRYTGSRWVIDLQLDDMVMDVSAGGTHNLRGIVITINHNAEVFLRRTVYTRNEVAIEYIHSHINSNSVFYDDRNTHITIFGAGLLSRSYTCLGGYQDDVLRLQSNLTYNYRRINFLTFFNYLYQFLSKENSNSPLNTVTNLREKYSEIAYQKLSAEDVKYLVDNDVVMFDKVINPQNCITYDMRVDYDKTPEHIRERYQAYLHDDKFYMNLTVPNTDRTYEEYDGMTIPYGNTYLPINIIENDHTSEASKVFYTNVFNDSSAELLQYALHQANSTVDTSIAEPQADHHQAS